MSILNREAPMVKCDEAGRRGIMHMLVLSPCIDRACSLSPPLIDVAGNLRFATRLNFHAKSTGVNRNTHAGRKGGPSDNYLRKDISAEQDGQHLLSRQTQADDGNGAKVFGLPQRPGRLYKYSSQPSFDQNFCHIFPVAELTGIKRERSESDLDDMSSGSDSDSDVNSEDGRSLDGYDIVLHETLPSEHAFLRVRAALALFSYGKIVAWLASSRYDTPPDDRQSPRKYVKLAGQRHRSIRPRFAGYFHYSCPFYKRDPLKYKDCLLRHGLQSVEDVIRHLQRHHMQPAYCPICRQTFQMAMERDQHTRERKCVFRKFTDIEGITKSQVDRILKRDKIRLGEKRRWLRIWHTVFPDAQFHSSPYLDQGVELTVSMVQDQWTAHGMDLVLQFLQGCGLLGREWEDEEMAVRVLHGLIFDDLVRF